MAGRPEASFQDSLLSHHPHGIRPKPAGFDQETRVTGKPSQYLKSWCCQSVEEMGSGVGEMAQG